MANLQEAIQNWDRAFGYKQMTEIVVNTRQLVKVVFLSKKNSIAIKLIEPIEGNSNITSFVRRGGGFHHLCFKCSDMEKQIQHLNENGIRTLVAPQPGEAFENEKIAFMLTKFGINIELIDSDKKAKLIKK